MGFQDPQRNSTRRSKTSSSLTHRIAMGRSRSSFTLFLASFSNVTFPLPDPSRLVCIPKPSLSFKPGSPRANILTEWPSAGPGPHSRPPSPTSAGRRHPTGCHARTAADSDCKNITFCIINCKNRGISSMCAVNALIVRI